MSIFRPRHPLLRGLWFLARGAFFLLTIPWVRKQTGKFVPNPFARKTGKVVDATGSVVEETKH